jgi:uncharacterized membrane protein (DUF2068 family)
MEQPRPRRGWVSLYAVAFALLLLAGAVFAFATFGQLESLGLLRVSAWLSVAAIVAAVVSVVIPVRR